MLWRMKVMHTSMAARVRIRALMAIREAGTQNGMHGKSPWRDEMLQSVHGIQKYAIITEIRKDSRFCIVTYC